MSGAESRPRPPPSGCSTTSTSSRPPFATSATTCPPSFYRRLPNVADDEFAGLPRVVRDGARARSAAAPAASTPQRLHRFVTAFQSVTPADDRRAVGVAERAEAGAGRAPARRAPTSSRRDRRPPRSRPIGSPARSRQHGAVTTTLAVRDPSGVRHPAAAALARVRRSGRGRCGSELDAALAARGTVGRRRHPLRRAAPGGRAGLHGEPDRQPAARFDRSTGASSSRASASSSRCCSAIRPAVYGRMDFRSRDRYRHAVEELADPTGDAQLRVALKSVERARQIAEQTPDARARARRLPPDWRRPPPVRDGRRLVAGL